MVETHITGELGWVASGRGAGVVSLTIERCEKMITLRTVELGGCC